MFKPTKKIFGRIRGDSMNGHVNAYSKQFIEYYKKTFLLQENEQDRLEEQKYKERRGK